MSSRSAPISVFPSNAAWLASCLPGWLAFRRAVRHVRETQESILFRIIQANRATEFGRRHGFDSIRSIEDFQRLPLTDYTDYESDIGAIAEGKGSVLTHDPVEVLQPTGGSTSGSKLIPYTAMLRREFRAAIDPWIAGLVLTHPRLLWGRHYWSISPNSPSVPSASRAVRIGFADDAEYLGLVQQHMVRRLFAVPSEMRGVADPESFRYLTLLFLLRERNLRLISVWHPSFLTLLLDAIPAHIGSFVDDLRAGSIRASLSLDPPLRQKLAREHAADPERADELAAMDVACPDAAARIWPDLRVVSCWSDGWSRGAAEVLRTRVPHAKIQGKGLLATEGVVSFPVGEGDRRVCAIRSHFLEFMEPDSGAVRHAWDVEASKTYRVILTTGGGLYRYRLHDLVRVTGFLAEAPCVEFVSKDNDVSDLVGEKLDSAHVAESIRRTETSCGVRFDFSMLAPQPSGAGGGYVLYVKVATDRAVDGERIASGLDAELSRNYHYRHARRIGQLARLRVFRVRAGAEAAYQARRREAGQKAGDIKPVALSTEVGWESIFDGDYV